MRSPQDMQRLQNDNYNVFAENALPFLLSHINESRLSEKEKSYLAIASFGDTIMIMRKKGPTVFVCLGRPVRESGLG